MADTCGIKCDERDDTARAQSSHVDVCLIKVEYHVLIRTCKSILDISTVGSERDSIFILNSIPVSIVQK